MKSKKKQSSVSEEVLSLDLLVAIMGKEHTVSDIPSAPCVGRLNFENADEWIIKELGIEGRDLYCGSSSGHHVIVSDLGKVEIPYAHFEGDSEESHTRIITHLLETIQRRVREKRNEPLDETPLGKKLSYPLCVCLTAPQYTVGVFPTAPLIGTLPDFESRPLHLQISSWEYRPILSLGEVAIPKKLIRRDIGERVHDGFQPEKGVDYTRKQYPLENYLMKILKERVENCRTSTSPNN